MHLHQPGTDIVKQGDLANCCFIIRLGKCEVILYFIMLYAFLSLPKVRGGAAAAAAAAPRAIAAAPRAAASAAALTSVPSTRGTRGQA